MRFLRNFVARFTSGKFRRNIGMVIAAVQAFIMKTPFIGKQIWRFRMNKLLEKPSRVHIELTSVCNAKCIMCPRHLMDRKMEVMDIGLFKKVVDESAQLGVKNFGLNGYGEIFTAKKYYRDYVNYIFEKVPNADIVINTNASLMSEEDAQFLIDMKIETVHIDIDGATKETFELVREKLKFEDVVNNVRKLSELKKAQGKVLPKVRVGMILQKENEHELEAHYNMWKDVVDYTSSDYMVSRLDSVEKFKDEKIVGHPCSLPYTDLNIWTDGSVVMCCDDWNAEYKMANARTATVKEIWNNENFKHIRALHQAGRQSEISTCSKCDWSRPGADWIQAHREVKEEDIVVEKLYKPEEKKAS